MRQHVSNAANVVKSKPHRFPKRGEVRDSTVHVRLIDQSQRTLRLGIEGMYPHQRDALVTGLIKCSVQNKNETDLEVEDE